MATYRYNDFTYSQEEIDDKVNSLNTSLEEYLTTHPEIIEEEEETTEAVVVGCDPGYEKNSEGECVAITETVSKPLVVEEELIDLDPKIKKLDNSKEAILKRRRERAATKIQEVRSKYDYENYDVVNDTFLTGYDLDEVVVTPETQWTKENFNDYAGVSIFSGGTAFERENLRNKAQGFADATVTTIAEDPEDYNRQLGPYSNNDYKDNESSFNTPDRGDMGFWNRMHLNPFDDSNGNGKWFDLQKEYENSITPGIVFNFGTEKIETKSNLKIINIQDKRDEYVNNIKNNLIEEAATGVGDGSPDWKTDMEAYVAFKKKLIYEPLTKVVNPLAEKIIKEGAQFDGPIDSKIIELNKKQENATGLDLVNIKAELFKLKDDKGLGGKLYDARTQKLVDFEKAGEDVVQVTLGGDELAKTTELDDLKTMLVDSYYDVVASAKTMVEYIDSLGDYNTDKLQVFKLATEGDIERFANVMLNNSSVEDDYNIIKKIAETGKITKDLTRFPGNHPLATLLNNSITEYLTVNRAVRTNTNPITSRPETTWETFKQSFYTNVKTRVPYGKIPFYGSTDNINDISSRESVDLIKGAFNSRGYTLSDSALYNERMKMSFGQFVGSFPDLGFFVAELAPIGGPIKSLGMLEKGKKGINALLKAFKATPTARSSKIMLGGGTIVLGAAQEAIIFGAHTAIYNPHPSQGEMGNSLSFGATLGGVMTAGQQLVNLFPAKYMSPFMKYLSKYKTPKNQGGQLVGAFGIGAPAFEISSAIHDWDGFKNQSTADFIKHYLAEGTKLWMLGNRSMFWNIGGVKAMVNDIRQFNGKASLNITKNAKKWGFDVKQLENPTIDTQDQLEIKQAEEINKLVEDTTLEGENFDEAVAKTFADFNEADALIEINIFQEKQKLEDNTGVTRISFPSDGDVYIISTKIKKGEELTAEENQMLSNIPNSVKK